MVILENRWPRMLDDGEIGMIIEIITSPEQLRVCLSSPLPFSAHGHSTINLICLSQCINIWRTSRPGPPTVFTRMCAPAVGVVWWRLLVVVCDSKRKHKDVNTHHHWRRMRERRVSEWGVGQPVGGNGSISRRGVVPAARAATRSVGLVDLRDL